MRLLSILALTFLTATVHAQSHPQWGNLEPGPWGVGVRVINTWDYSRSYWPPRDWRGQERQVKRQEQDREDAGNAGRAAHRSGVIGCW